MTANEIPQGLKDNPKLSQWVRFDEDQTVCLKTGKVELGQGIDTALVQIVADELGIPPDMIRLAERGTSATPDEGWTSASISIELGGASVRLVCAEIRRIFTGLAAERLNVDTSELQIEAGFFSTPDNRKASYWQMASHVDMERHYIAGAPPTDPGNYEWVGTDLPRRDLLAKITGPAFIHDIIRPGMLHGRVLRVPRAGEKLITFDIEALEKLDGVEAVVVDGSFVGICGKREEDMEHALAKAVDLVTWSDEAPLPPPGPVDELLRELPNKPTVISQKGRIKAAVRKAGEISLKGSFSKPFIAHASIGPVCALAEFSDDHLTVWSHSQGIYQLRSALARALNMPDDMVEVIHKDGAGCYGHNGADDVALDAALLARATGAPVRVIWTREDELTAAPFGSAMLIDIEANVGMDGKIHDWKQDVYSMTHLMRPGWGEGVNLLAASQIKDPSAASEIADPALKPHGGGGMRNAVPLYVFGNQEIIYRFIKETPLRTSALRSLGAFANVFAIESFLDDIADRTGQDPVALRLAHLEDERARNVIKEAARLSGWQSDVEGAGDWGRGIGFAQYKNKGAYCAIVAEVRIDEAVRVDKIYAAVDAGLIINPDGVRNQIEGGILQAISWVLKEQVVWDSQQIVTRSWEDYSILAFNEIPSIELTLIDQSEFPGRGVGECAAGPVAGALANAVFHALGARIRDLPITAERILSALV